MARTLYYVNSRTGAIQATSLGSKHHQRLSRLKEWEPLEVAPAADEPATDPVESTAPSVTDEGDDLMQLRDEEIDDLAMSPLKDLAASLGMDTGFRKKADLQQAVKDRLTALRGDAHG